MLLRLAAWAGLMVALVLTAGMALAVAAGERLPRAELAYVGYHNAQSDIFVYDSAHGIHRNLTNSGAYDLSPAWSPDGQQIAFISDRSLGLHVFVMNANGQNLRRLTPPGRAYEFPRWSADGARLAFMARGSAGAEVFTVNADGSGFQQVGGETANPGQIMLELGMDTPATSGPFSPAGTSVLDVGFVDELGWALLIAPNADTPGTPLVSLGRLFGEATAISWSPDGRQIAFLSSKDGTVDLYLIAPQPGSAARRVTAGAAYESHPIWRPLAGGA